MAIRFQLGKVVMTQGVADLAYRIDVRGYLAKHQTGDWGSTNSEDKETNDNAVKTGGRILSAYPIDPALPCKGYGENTLWIITEADRSVTTLLLQTNTDTGAAGAIYSPHRCFFLACPF